MQLEAIAADTARDLVGKSRTEAELVEAVARLACLRCGVAAYERECEEKGQCSASSKRRPGRG